MRLKRKNVEIDNKPRLERIVSTIILNCETPRIRRNTRRTMKNDAEVPTTKTEQMENKSTQFHISRKNGWLSKILCWSKLLCAAVNLFLHSQVSEQKKRAAVSAAKRETVRKKEKKKIKEKEKEIQTTREIKKEKERKIERERERES